MFRSTARISPCEHVGIGSIHDSHTAPTENTNNKFSSVAVIDGGAKDGDTADGLPHTKDLSFRLTREPQLKLTTQVRVAAGFLPPDLH